MLNSFAKTRLSQRAFQRYDVEKGIKRRRCGLPLGARGETGDGFPSSAASAVGIPKPRVLSLFTF